MSSKILRAEPSQLARAREPLASRPSQSSSQRPSVRLWAMAQPQRQQQVSNRTNCSRMPAAVKCRRGLKVTRSGYQPPPPGVQASRRRTQCCCRPPRRHPEEARSEAKPPHPGHPYLRSAVHPCLRSAVTTTPERLHRRVAVSSAQSQGHSRRDKGSGGPNDADVDATHAATERARTHPSVSVAFLSPPPICVSAG